MQIKFLGTGGALDLGKGTAAAIVTLGDKTILVDSGFSTILSLVKSGRAKDIDYILITHLHGDHIGSLPTLLAYFQYKLGIDVPKIIVPNEVFQAELLQFLTLVGEKKRANFVPISDFDDIGFIDTTNQHVEEMTSFSYYFVENDNLIYYSGDIGNADTAKSFLDSRTESKKQVFHETTPKTESPIHTTYLEVQEKLKDYETYVYHMAKEDMPSDCTLKMVENQPEFLA